MTSRATTVADEQYIAIRKRIIARKNMDGVGDPVLGVDTSLFRVINSNPRGTVV